MADRNDPRPSQGMHNEFPGTADNVIQARKIVGDVHIHSAQRGPLVVPRQLPSRPTHFTGRTVELAQLDAFLAHYGAGLQSTVVISAFAGVGKTALAVHWAHSVRERFADGDLHLNLQGYDTGPPLSAHQALEYFLVSLGVHAASIPADLDGRTALYRQVTSARRLVILLDNVRSAAQVRPLLPGSSSSLVLVTSRSQLGGLVAREGAHRIDLKTLTSEESVDLLRSILGRERVDAEPHASARLTSRCVQLPLALRIAAERVAIHPSLSLEHLATQLESGNRRLDALATYDDDESTAVRVVFSWSYRDLSAEAARTFRMLSLIPGPDFSVAAAAAVTGRSLGETVRYLGRLVGSYLIEVVGPDRYRFHDLLRDYACECASDDDEQTRSEAVKRLLTWYLLSAQKAALQLAPRSRSSAAGASGGDDPAGLPVQNFPTQAMATKWCELEILNLLAACRLAVDAGEYAVAWQLPLALRWFFQLQRPTTDWVEACQIAVGAAARLRDRQAEMNALRNLGAAFAYCARFEESLQSNTEALAACRELGEDEGWCLNSIGDALSWLGRSEEAADILTEALAVAERNGNATLAAHSLENLAPAYRALGRNNEAISSLQRSLSIFHELQYPFGEALVLDKLADTHLALGHFDEAADFGLQALALHVAVGNRLHEAATLRILARAHQSSGRLLEARDHLRRAVEILEALGHPDAIGMRDELGSL
ncbi:tetratricopeptide repeat protein [Streptomyces sp. NPDC006207]